MADLERAESRAAEEVNANIERADDLLRAIQAYERDHGQFPESLAVLVPTYVARIPETIAGGDYRYRLDDRYGQLYYLCFDIAANPSRGCCYHRRLEIWDCSPGPAH